MSESNTTIIKRHSYFKFSLFVLMAVVVFSRTQNTVIFLEFSYFNFKHIGLKEYET